MTERRWSEAWLVYDQICRLPEAEQAAWLESAGVDPGVAGIVSDLLARQMDEDPVWDADEWPRLGKRIGRFEIVEGIGRGGMGAVYLARDTDLDRTVALKFLAGADISSA